MNNIFTGRKFKFNSGLEVEVFFIISAIGTWGAIARSEKAIAYSEEGKEINEVVGIGNTPRSAIRDLRLEIVKEKNPQIKKAIRRIDGKSATEKLIDSLLRTKVIGEPIVDTIKRAHIPKTTQEKLISKSFPRGDK